MKLILISVGTLMIVATLIPISRNEAWWIRIFDFPRFQIMIISAVTLAVYWLFAGSFNTGDYLFAAALALCTLYQSYMIYPYTRFSGKQVQQSLTHRKDSSFTLLFANVLMCNRNGSGLREIIRAADPDIILTVETDNKWKEQLKEFEQTHPFTIQHPQDNTYGMLFYSRLELLNPEVRFLVEDDVPSIRTRVILPSGLEGELHCLHPKPPFITESDRSIERDAELLIVGKEIKEKNIPVVVLGDLNDVAWSRTNYMFQNISGLLDPRIGRGFYNTFHAKWPLIRFPLDHFFLSRHFRLIDFRRLEYFGSDHFPVFIAVSYEPDAESEQEELQADESEEKEARNKIERAV